MGLLSCELIPYEEQFFKTGKGLKDKAHKRRERTEGNMLSMIATAAAQGKRNGVTRVPRGEADQWRPWKPPTQTDSDHPIRPAALVGRSDENCRSVGLRSEGGLSNGRFVSHTGRLYAPVRKLHGTQLHDMVGQSLS
ncbi:hypothetical protein FOPG_19414 [Fusarium oxysporum f. sp. conglutinans race 2 54008]|uniref:Uncharacterized protein n=1 Tax=Fusarium oxysporum f. sp. conglutinans race 2 54008 TaxID=1089457 RepID=X0HT35_FUSOX|nr:hypothetical protein FOPG_19414 [Fusarium oxysporum f. sp. conglutinans race 2 54008]